MPLSEWPEHFKDAPEPRGQIVTVRFDPEMLVAVVTPKAIGLKEKEGDRDISIWIPVSQISGDVPKRDEWIGAISMTKWIADQKELEYED